MGPSMHRAVERMRAGGLVVYPTDTLYGIGADATNFDAVEALIRLRARDGAQPISVAVSSIEEIEPLAELGEEARSYVRTHLPGPYTILARPTLRARDRLAAPIVGTNPTIGIRVPDHPLARELAREIGGPITATSANLHGAPPVRSIAQARARFGSAAGYLDGPPHPSGAPSTLVDVTGTRPRIRSRP